MPAQPLLEAAVPIEFQVQTVWREKTSRLLKTVDFPIAATLEAGPQALPPVQVLAPMPVRPAVIAARTLTGAEWQPWTLMPRIGSLRTSLDPRHVLSEAGFQLAMEAAGTAVSRREESGPLFEQAKPVMPVLTSRTVHEQHLPQAPVVEKAVAPAVVSGTTGLPALAGFLPMAQAIARMDARAIATASPLPMAVATVLPSVQLSQATALAPEATFASVLAVHPAAGAVLMAEVEALSPAIERPRLPALGLFGGRERLRVEGTIREDVPSTVAAALPVAHQPGSLAAGSMLPALGSIFRHSKAGRAPRVTTLAIEGVHPRNVTSMRLAYRELPMPIRPPQVPLESPLRIVETFHYLRPLESPGVEPLRALLRFWQSVPLYARYASVAACLILLLWTISPGGGVTDTVAARWGTVQRSLENRAAVDLTDDFRTGLEDWHGAAARWERSWAYDEAGFIRPGKLALYTPSMKMRDYRVEFMVQIDRRSSGWVFRAADHLNYYATKLAISKPGPLPLLSLIHYPVIGGTEGPKVEVPIRLYMHNNTPYRVQLTVQGNNFTTMIEGQIVDFWRDDKLQIGGFGFFSDTGARARVYWMKLAHQDDFIGRVCAYFYENPIHRRRSDEVYQ